MASITGSTTYPSTTLAKGQGHPSGYGNAQAIAKVLAWVARNGAQAAKLPSAAAVAKAAGVNTYAGQYAYRQYLRTSGQRVGRGRQWYPQPQAAARKVAKANAAQAAKAKAGKAGKAQPQPVQAAQPQPPASA